MAGILYCLRFFGPAPHVLEEQCRDTLCKPNKFSDDAQQYITPQSDPVMWDVVNGLSILVPSNRSTSV